MFFVFDLLFLESVSLRVLNCNQHPFMNQHVPSALSLLSVASMESSIEENGIKT